jgi:hypothetical protein
VEAVLSEDDDELSELDPESDSPVDVLAPVFRLP